MKIIVLGGDGFCGWPSSLNLAADGHEVLIVDNLVRRTISDKISAPSLTPIRSINERIEAAQKIGNVRFENCDIAKETGKFKEILAEFKADAIVHFAEQRSAPYSMLGDAERKFTIDNNVSGTNNLMSTLVELNQRPHIVHLGTMGVYGYNDDFGEIPEGYLDVKVNQTGKDVSIVYPGNPGSIYHLTKVLDHQMMQFYAKNWGFQITDLHQGVVWGTDTEHTASDPALINRFDYDGEYGTVLNRLISQAQVGYPMTVLKGLADLIAEKTGAKIKPIENPRKELAANSLRVSNQGLRSLGFEPIKLGEGLLAEIENTVGQYADRLDKNVILSKARW